MFSRSTTASINNITSGPGYLSLPWRLTHPTHSRVSTGHYPPGWNLASQPYKLHLHNHRNSRPNPISTRSGLHARRRTLLCPLLTPVGISQHLTMPVAQRPTDRPPRVMHTHLHAYARRI